MKIFKIHTYKISLTISCFLLITTVLFAQSKIKNTKSLPTDIFLLIGQSNMAGVGPIASLDTITLDNVFLFNDKDEAFLNNLISVSTLRITK